MIDQVKNEYGNDRTLILNAGNNFDVASHDIHIAPSYIVKALALSGTEVITPGIQEFAYGSEKLRKMLDNSSIQVVSANVPGFTPYVILSKNKGKIKVLVTSAVDPELLTNHLSVTKAIIDPVTALRQIQQEIPHDLFVVIMHADQEKITSVIGKCPGIDLVIDAMSKDIVQKQERSSQPPVVSNNEDGMFVAYIDYDGQNKMGPNFSNLVKLRAVVGQVAEDPQIFDLVKDYEQKRQTGLRQKSRAALHPAAQFKDHSPYLGSRSCNLCHSEINDTWASSKHANAMDSLVGKSKENDPDCLSCHVTGMVDNPSASGFLRVSGEHPMAGVQCEACHGPGADHSRNPIDVDMLSVNENTCTRCHTNYTDPEFDYNQDISIVKHGRVKIGLNHHLGPEFK